MRFKKNRGFALVRVLREHLDRLHSRLTPKNLFACAPIIRFDSGENNCLCGNALKVAKTCIKTVATLEIGEFCAHETIAHCPSCQHTYGSDELRRLVPAGGRFGYDVIVHIGKSLFLHCRNEREIQAELAQLNISISIREIGYLGRRFIIYLVLAHREAGPDIRKLIKSRGGYILHLDGTCEGDSPHLMTALDEIATLVLGNVKIPSENSGMLAPFLRQLKKDYGAPIASVHDMGKGIIDAIAEVFPNKPDYICHFHFLRDIGKDLFDYEHALIRKRLKKHRIRPLLRQLAKTLRQHIDATSKLSKVLNAYHTDCKQLPMSSHSILVAYTLILWILDSASELGGFGFPFDRPHLVFYRRLEAVAIRIDGLSGKDSNLSKLRHIIGKVMSDASLQIYIAKTQEKVRIFDQLRDTMRIAQTSDNRGLNDNGEDVDMKTIKKRVENFRSSESLQQAAHKDKSYRKMVEQIDRYWEKLFADPIVVGTPAGPVAISPQRTNNILERFFRCFKKDHRKKSGAHSLNRVLKTMLADTPLVKNLENPEYVKLMLGERKNLAERFADIDVLLIRREMKLKQQQPDRIPSNLKKLIRMPEFLSRFVPSKLAAA